MRFYLEITLLTSPEIGLNFLWSKVFQQIHLGLVETQDAERQSPIGIGFPKYWNEETKFSLGSKCRLFATNQATLERFAAPQRLARLSDYVHCTSIRPVPEAVTGYATYRRLQPKTNPERLARRYAKRHKLSEAEAMAQYRDMAPVSVSTPFIRLTSLSNGETFCLWINKTLSEKPVAGDFNSYGLSATATVPEF